MPPETLPEMIAWMARVFGTDPPGCASAPHCCHAAGLRTRAAVPVVTSSTGTMVRCMRAVRVAAQEVSA